VRGDAAESVAPQARAGDFSLGRATPHPPCRVRSGPPHSPAPARPPLAFRSGSVPGCPGELRQRAKSELGRARRRATSAIFEPLHPAEDSGCFAGCSFPLCSCCCSRPMHRRRCWKSP
jgi:hypothetical protein